MQHLASTSASRMAVVSFSPALVSVLPTAVTNFVIIFGREVLPSAWIYSSSFDSSMQPYQYHLGLPTGPTVAGWAASLYLVQGSQGSFVKKIHVVHRVSITKEECQSMERFLVQ